ncbi:dihydrofolate reductase [Mergibacter septicus]|uniref:type 3 dihydrofolate reductase n=1 Tax=Mergibacter septicus TaxID=221402 RepID=UPI001C75C958|nr:type 3 dihydrofolate reductase [Mergibacter septicus]QDJ13315.1 dihydrofolate reductase [Mergibacter septicus]
MIISLIVAMTKNRVIGRNNKMPWHLPQDLRWFKQNTLGKPIIMGRKTFLSIGKALPQRQNIVLSRTQFNHPNIDWANNLSQAIELARPANEIMVIGGGELFTQTLKLADKLYLTEIQTELEGDTYFPEIHFDEWETEYENYISEDQENPYSCRFMILKRKCSNK